MEQFITSSALVFSSVIGLVASRGVLGLVLHLMAVAARSNVVAAGTDPSSAGL